MIENKKTCFFATSPTLWGYKVNDPFADPYRHMITEDIANHAFPYYSENSIRLRSNNETISRLFERHNRVADFMRECIKELMDYKQIAFEICADDTGNTVLAPFPANSLRCSVLRGKYYQKIPNDKNVTLYTDSDILGQGRKYFNKEDFFIIETPKIFLKEFPKFINRSLLLRREANIDTITECYRNGIPYDCPKEIDLFKHKIFSDIGRSRGDMQELMTEYYYLLRGLRFARFTAMAREDLVKQINKSIKTICKKLKQPENEFIINGLVSSDEYTNIEEKLKKRQISFEEVTNKIYNKNIK